MSTKIFNKKHKNPLAITISLDLIGSGTTKPLAVYI